MYFRNLPIFAVLLSVGVEALLPRSLPVTRQLFGACDTPCEPWSSAMNTCTTAACLCTNAVATSLQICVDCLTVGIHTVDVIGNIQAVVDSYFIICTGITVHTVTVNGGTPSTISGASVTATAGLPSLALPSATTTPAQTVVKTSASANSTSSASGSAPTSKPGLAGASSRNMVAEVGMINVVGGVILGMMLVL